MKLMGRPWILSLLWGSMTSPGPTRRKQEDLFAEMEGCAVESVTRQDGRRDLIASRMIVTSTGPVDTTHQCAGRCGDPLALSFHVGTRKGYS